MQNAQVHKDPLLNYKDGEFPPIHTPFSDSGTQWYMGLFLRQFWSQTTGGTVRIRTVIVCSAYYCYGPQGLTLWLLYEKVILTNPSPLTISMQPQQPSTPQSKFLKSWRHAYVLMAQKETTALVEGWKRYNSWWGSRRIARKSLLPTQTSSQCL